MDEDLLLVEDLEAFINLSKESSEFEIALAALKNL